MPDLDIRGTNRIIFDAFVIYDSKSSDTEFVNRMANILEGPEHNLRLFIPGRDDNEIQLTNLETADIILNRCKKCIVVLSNTFNNSETAAAQLRLIHNVSLVLRNRRIIPVLIEPCRVPVIIGNLTLCDYCKEDLHPWFWRRLSQAISLPGRSTPRSNPVASLPDVVLDSLNL